MTQPPAEHRVQWAFWLLVGIPLLAFAILGAYFHTGTGVVVLVAVAGAYILVMPVPALIWLTHREVRKK